MFNRVPPDWAWQIFVSGWARRISMRTCWVGFWRFNIGILTLGYRIINGNVRISISAF